MKVIVCIDDNGGMLFNKRRQSRDRKVLEDISLMTDKIWMVSVKYTAVCVVLFGIFYLVYMCMERLVMTRHED